MVANSDKIMMHGGDLSAAIAKYGGERADWLDLSSGINHISYPINAEKAFESIDSLPSHKDLVSCLEAARNAYGVSDDVAIVASPGTQSLIQAMPVLLGTSQSCLILGPTYSEHQRAMARAGVDVAMINEVPEEFYKGDCLLVVNPNNPDGRLLPVEQLISLAKELEKQDGLLIVDEAFVDIIPSASLVPHLEGLNNCVILRSFGKFFGLAGLRLGFLLGSETHVGRIRDMLGPWAVSTPALRIGTEALSDLDWQEQQRARMDDRAAQLDDVLMRRGLPPAGGTGLFRLVVSEEAEELHDKLAQQQIWTRIFDYRKDFLRFGVPANDEDLKRLEVALSNARRR